MKIKKYLLLGFIIMAVLFKYSDKKIDDDDNILKKVEYKKIEVNDVADLYEKRDEEGLYVYSNSELDLRGLSSEGIGWKIKCSGRGWWLALLWREFSVR